MNWIALVGRLLLAVVFLVAAVGKLADRAGSRRALADFGLPRTLIVPVAVLLPFTELAIAALLVPGATARWGALAALAMLGLFIAAVSISLARGRTPDCHCFGQLHSAPVGGSTIARNVALAAIAGVVLWRGGASPALATAITGVNALAWSALAVAGIAVAFVVIEAWFILNLLRQQGRLLVRVEALEADLGRAQPTGLPVGQPAPDFRLRSIAGDTVSLTEMRAIGRPILLFFTNPTCAPCDAILPDVARWQRELHGRVDIAVISRGSATINAAKAEKHGLSTVLLQKEREVIEAYEIESTPSAVLVGADGKIASSIGYGAEGIEGLLRLGLDGAAPGETVHKPNGRHGDRRGSDAPTPPSIGEPAPTLILPDLAGKPTSLADFRGTPTLLLFWSPACGFCQQMLPELKAWERKRPVDSPRLLIVSTGDAESNRAMGLRSPLVLDAGESTMRSFGASGTPMAVLVDANGNFASSVAVGARAVMALASARHAASV